MGHILDLGVLRRAAGDTQRCKRHTAAGNNHEVPGLGSVQHGDLFDRKEWMDLVDSVYNRIDLERRQHSIACAPANIHALTSYVFISWSTLSAPITLNDVMFIC